MTPASIACSANQGALVFAPWDEKSLRSLLIPGKVSDVSSITIDVSTGVLTIVGTSGSRYTLCPAYSAGARPTFNSMKLDIALLASWVTRFYLT